MRIIKAPVVGGGGAPVNIDTTYELGGMTLSAGVTLPCNGANTKSAEPWVEIATASDDLAGIRVYAINPHNANARYGVDIAIGEAGSEVIILPNWWVAPTATGKSIYLPLNVPGGTKIWGRAQTTGSAAGVQVAIRGEVRTADTPPLYDNCELLSAYSANLTLTAPQTVDVQCVEAADSNWVVYPSKGADSTTFRDYGALLVSEGVRATAANPSTAQMAQIRVGIGDPEVVLASVPTAHIGGTPGVSMTYPGLIETPIPAGSTISVEILASTAGDLTAPQIWGFW